MMNQWARVRQAQTGIISDRGAHNLQSTIVKEGNLSRLLDKRWAWQGAAITIMLLVMLAGAGGAMAASPSLVINEVYAPTTGDPASQWVELYNRSGSPLLMDGWKLRTSQSEYTLNATNVLTNGYVLITFSRAGVTDKFTLPGGAVVVDLGLDNGKLDPQADMLQLVSPAGLVVDQMNWGSPSSGWKNANPGLWQPGIAPLTNAQASIGRTWSVEGRDTDSPADFTIHDPYSPGGKIPFALDPSDLLGRPTDYMSWAAGVLLWVGFIMAAFIARRFQNLSGQRTYWQALLIAPSGILIYTIIQGNAFFDHGAMRDSEKWTGFPILFLSAVLCFYVIAIFSQIAKRYLEASK